MLKEKNQSLLNELSSATAAKLRVQRTKKWVIIFFLATIAVFSFSSNIYARFTLTALTIFSVFIFFQARQIADQINLKERFSIGKRAGDEASQRVANTDNLFVSTSKTTKVGLKDPPKITTQSPFGSSNLRNRKFTGKHSEESSSFDPSAAEKLLQSETEPSEPVQQFDGHGRNAALSINKRASLSNSNLFASPNVLSYGFGSRAQPTAFVSSPSPHLSTEAPTQQVYHLSPLNTGSVKGPKSSSSKIKDALQVLEMKQLPELWVERLREILGKDLTRIMNLYDEAVDEMVDVMKRGGLSNADLQKAILLLEMRSPTGKEVLPSSRNTITLDDVVKYVQQLQCSSETIHKFEQTVSFLRLCQWMIELRQQNSSATSTMSGVGRSNADPYLSSFFAFGQDNNSKHRKLTPLIDRLRVMAHESSDFGLRIHWSNMDINEVILSGRVEHEILDQEVAMALYLHRCDSIASMRVISATKDTSTNKFSRTHYAFSTKDVNQRIRPELSNQMDGFTGGLGNRLHTILLQRTVTDVASSGGENVTPSSLTVSKPPHFDILHISPMNGNVEEVLTIDVSRHDVFESILVFMLVVYFGSHDAFMYNNNSQDRPTIDDLPDDDMGGSSSIADTFDYRIIKHLIEEIVGKDELIRLMDFQRSTLQSRVKQNALKNANSAEKLVASGFGFGSPGHSPMSPMSNHFHLHHHNQHNVAVSSQIRMPLSAAKISFNSNLLASGGGSFQSPATSSSVAPTPMSTGRSFRTMFSNADTSIMPDAYSLGGQDRNGTGVDTSHAHNFSRYMNTSNSFTSPH